VKKADPLLLQLLGMLATRVVLVVGDSPVKSTVDTLLVAMILGDWGGEEFPVLPRGTLQEDDDDTTSIFALLLLLLVLLLVLRLLTMSPSDHSII
jgi:hypothetical protein